MPLSCPVFPPSQRELHKDGGGDGVARRVRAAWAAKAKSQRHVLRNALHNALRRVLNVLAVAAAAAAAAASVVLLVVLVVLLLLVVVVREGGPIFRRRRAPVAAHARTRGRRGGPA